MLALLIAAGLLCAPAAAAHSALPNVEHLPPDCLSDTRLGGPGKIEFVVWCSVRPGKMRFEIEPAAGVRLNSVPARVAASGEGARGHFRCQRTRKGARCAGYVGGALTLRGKLGVAPADRCEPLRIKTYSFLAGGKPLGCPDTRKPRLRIDWPYFRGFRIDDGMEFDLRGDRPAIDRRIRKAVANWRRGEPVARVMASEMGLPLLPLEVRRLELREELLSQTTDALERWVPDHAADTYAAYTIDTSGPVVIRIGFTGDQAAQLALFKRQNELFAPAQVQGFLIPPRYSEKQLGEYEDQLVEVLVAGDSPLSGLVNSVGRGLIPAKVEVGTEHVAKVKRLLLEMFATLDPFAVRFEHPAVLL
ncbi:MAG: hypothetical protein AB7V58_08570 [Solirubrobacterales bacterium]